MAYDIVNNQRTTEAMEKFYRGECLSTTDMSSIRKSLDAAKPEQSKEERQREADRHGGRGPYGHVDHKMGSGY